VDSTIPLLSLSPTRMTIPLSVDSFTLRKQRSRSRRSGNAQAYAAYTRGEDVGQDKQQGGSLDNRYLHSPSSLMWTTIEVHG
jgi:hypothetical protein